MVKKINKEKTRIINVIVFGLFLLAFVAVNAQQYVAGAIAYAFVGILTIFLYNQWGTFGSRSDLEGVDDNFMKDSLIGVGLGIGTLFLGAFVPFIGAIGIPPVASIAGIVGRFIVIVPGAAIFEETFFRGVVMDFFDSKLKVNKYVAIIITAIFFSLFHLVAYGQNLRATGGSFFSAALMGFIFGIVSEKQNSLIGSIFYHATLNAYIGFVKLAVIVG